ncbi:FAD-binding protein [Pleurocapsales cyanobacterium LEGE 10410]|nr:FAD-binding protein [Pleurocapsales cyanobacterium LEGE 10410]
MEKIKSFAANNLSFYRTTHHFERYSEFHSIEEFGEYCNWAKANNVKLYILGNGSNTLFVKKNITTLILKNSIPKSIVPLSESKVEVSSSTLAMDVLKYCYDNCLSSFYFLASVPATIGGALAMNAGKGKKHSITIYDFVESVTFFDFENNSLKTLVKEEIVKGYRETIFTGIHSRLILSAIFKFDQIYFDKNPIATRLKWSKEFQDYSRPNCGSVFKEGHLGISQKLSWLKIGKTNFSFKTQNWLLNKSSSHVPIVILINIVKILHILSQRKAILEVISVE